MAYGDSVPGGSVSSGFCMGGPPEAAHSFPYSDADSGDKPVEHSVSMALDDSDGVDHGLKAAVGWPEIPLGQECLCCLPWLVIQLRESR